MTSVDRPDSGPLARRSALPQSPVRVAAIDLGATSGRVIAVTVGPNQLDAVEIHRFADPTVLVPDAKGGATLTIDILAIWAGILAGLRRMAISGPIDGIGVDSWAVDYGLLDKDGNLIGNPVSYRDDRTTNIAESLFAANALTFAKLYQRTGIQYLPFNTIFQLAAERRNNPTRFTQAAHLLMLPDLFNYWLTGIKSSEITNASSTALVNPNTRDWDFGLITELEYPPHLFPPIIEPGKAIGELTPPLAEVIAPLTSTPARALAHPTAASPPIIAVASHDTASAVVAVPMADKNAAYISSGTWSLVGLELDHPVLTEQARTINATNELGVDGTVRFLRNTMGLWLLSSCQEQWRAEGRDIPLADLLSQASAAQPLKWLVDADSTDFLAPGKMADRIAAAAANQHGQPQTLGEIVRCVLDSLALASAKAVRELAEVANRKVDVIHIVGGGSLNTLLCQLTADATGCKVIAGPVEAAALGNALVQARALGVISGGLSAMRDIVRKTQPLIEYQPNPNNHQMWQQATPD